MKILRRLFHLHKFLSIAATVFTFLAIILNLCWNQFLADLINIFGYAVADDPKNGTHVIFAVLPTGIVVIFLHLISEYVSSCLASYTCEMYAHEMRMGYAGYYLQCDIRTLSKLNVGEEQSAMQNELKDISDYLKENLFSIMRQFGTFAVTAVFLLYQNYKLTLVSTIPVLPLILYCSFSSRIIKKDTEQCQSSKKKINGLAGTILDLFPVIQVYGAHRLIRGTMQEHLLEWENANIEKERIHARLMSLSGALSIIPLLLLLGFGGTMVKNGEISIGTFYIFINLSGNVSGFLQNMPGIYANFRRFRASVSRLEEKRINGKQAAIE